jgi:hypothetical protein
MFQLEANQFANMISIRFALAVALAVIVVILAFSVDAAYRKPPFNGSIFGKRSVTGKYKFFNLISLCNSSQNKNYGKVYGHQCKIHP